MSKGTKCEERKDSDRHDVVLVDKDKNTVLDCEGFWGGLVPFVYQRSHLSDPSDRHHDDLAEQTTNVVLLEQAVVIRARAIAA